MRTYKGIVRGLKLVKGDTIRVDWIQKDIAKTKSGLKKKLSEFYIIGRYVGKVKEHIKINICYSNCPYISETDGDKTFNVKKLEDDIRNRGKKVDRLEKDAPTEWRFYFIGIQKLSLKEAMLYDI